MKNVKERVALCYTALHESEYVSNGIPIIACKSPSGSGMITPHVRVERVKAPYITNRRVNYFK